MEKETITPLKKLFFALIAPRNLLSISRPTSNTGETGILSNRQRGVWVGGEALKQVKNSRSVIFKPNADFFPT